MSARPLRHIRSNLVAYLALFISLGATSYAALIVPANSVNSAAIRTGAVGARQLANRSVSAAKLDGKTILGHVALIARLTGTGQVIYSKPKVTFQGGFGAGISVQLAKPLPSQCALIATADFGPAPGTQSASVDVRRVTAGGKMGVLLETLGPSGQFGSPVAGIELVGICP